MEIVIKHLTKGAKEAKGTAVIIDVFRAASTACYVYGAGAKKIVVAKSLRQAFELKKRNPSYVLIGEKHGLFVKGFDYGNSPTKIDGQDLVGKTVVMKTSSGTQGILKARNAREILFASFVNAGATVKYIKNNDDRLVSLVPMGWEGKTPTEEDELCADYLRCLLEDKPGDYQKIFEYLRNTESAARFFGGNPEFPEKDFYYSTALDRFGYALKVLKEDDNLVISKA